MIKLIVLFWIILLIVKKMEIKPNQNKILIVHNKIITRALLIRLKIVKMMLNKT